MTQTVKLPNGDNLNFPDDMADDAIGQVIADNYPEYAPKQAKEAPTVLAGLPVKRPDPAPEADAAPEQDPNEAAPRQNQFAAGRMTRDDYEKEFRAINPRASDTAVSMALAQYDRQQAAARKAADTQRQAGPVKPIPGADDFFNTRLNARLQSRDKGIVQVQPAHEQQDFSSTSTQHAPDVGDESAASAAGSFLGRSTTAGLYDLAGAGAKLLDAINPFTTSDAEAAILFKDDPAKLKQMQDESIALGLGRFARAMQANSSEQMEKISPRAKQDYSLLEYATTDAKKSALLSPVKVIGDAVRSLPSSLAMGLSAYLTRGASLRAEQTALAAGLSAEAAHAAGVQAAMKMMGNAGAISEGGIGYAQQALQSQEEALKLPQAKLEQSPTYQALLKQGYTPETARAKMAADTGEHAGQIGGLVDATVNKFGGEFLGKIISEGGPFLRRVLAGAGNESATEFVQSAGEQLGSNFATQQNADPNQSTWGGVGEAAVAGAAVGGLMGGVTAGVAGHHGHVDENALAATVDAGRADAAAAKAARDAALGGWNTNGLSPSSRETGNVRVEPTWGEAVAGAAPAGRAEPSLADIGNASSVDEAIAAATAVAAAPVSPRAPVNTSAFPTVAEIDALEQQAGLMSAAEQPAAASPLEQAASANLPAAPQPEPGNLTNSASSAEGDDWHLFPPESRTLGVPRAQMPQIKAEHRGAMVNFLNARGISHEQVEVDAGDLKPTQREFSVSKVEKAIGYEGGNRSILISSDNYVLDGHHQWMAAAVKGEPIQAIRLNAPIKQLVQAVHDFPSSTVDASSAAAAPAPVPTRPGQELNDANAQRIQRQEDAVRQAAESLERRKSTGGQRARERVTRENPFLAFLGNHGVQIDERSDTGGQKGRAGGVMVPGYGPLYRRSGKRLDELAQLAHEAGFLSDQDMADQTDNGGTRKLADMIQRAAHSKEVVQPAGLLDAIAPTADERLIGEAQRLGIETEGKTADQLYDAVAAAHTDEEGRRVDNGASTVDEQTEIDHGADQITPQQLADADIPLDLNDPRLAPGHNLTDEEIDAIFGIQEASSARADRGEAEGSTAAPAREGAARTGPPGQAEEGDLLTSYTPGEVVAREDAAAARAKAVQAERDRLEAQRKKEQDAKEARARADATVDDFQLGQDAHDQLSGQTGLFDEPAPAPAHKGSAYEQLTDEERKAMKDEAGEVHVDYRSAYPIIVDRKGKAVVEWMDYRTAKKYKTKEEARAALIEAAKQESPEIQAQNRKEFAAKSGVGKIIAARERYSDKFGVSWASTNIASVNTMGEAMAIARAVAESGAENITDMRKAAETFMRGAKTDGEYANHENIRVEQGGLFALIQVAQLDNDKWISGKSYRAQNEGESAGLFMGREFDSRDDAVQFQLDRLKDRIPPKLHRELVAKAHGIGRDGMRDSDRAAKDMDSAVAEFTIQTKEELDDITPAEVRAGAIQWAKDAGLNEGEFLRTLYRKWSRNKNNLELQELAEALLEAAPAPAASTTQDQRNKENYARGWWADVDGAVEVSRTEADAMRKRLEKEAPGDEYRVQLQFGEKFNLQKRKRSEGTGEQTPIQKHMADTKAAAEDIDDGADIPLAFYAQVTVQHRVYSDDGKTSSMEDVPADVALESVRDDIKSMEAMLKCMGAH